MIWTLTAGLLLVVLLAQTIFGKYEPASDEVWAWLLPWLVPTLSLMYTVWSVRRLKENASQVGSLALFCATVLLSVLYLGMLLFIVGYLPRSPEPMTVLIRRTVWPLTAVQGLVTVLVGKFFVESVGNDQVT